MTTGYPDSQQPTGSQIILTKSLRNQNIKTCENGVYRAGNSKKTTQTQPFLRFVYF